MSTAAPTCDLLRLIGSDTKLTYVSGTRGGEYSSSCPFCGGEDRFHVQPAMGLWRCRQCAGTDHWSDAAGYVMQRQGLTYPEACRWLEDQYGSLPPVKPYTPPTVDPANFISAAHVCHQTLLASPKPLGWLAARGIDLETVKRHTLGYVPYAGAVDREINGHRIGYLQQQIEGHWIACGITIPMRGVDGTLYGIKIRRAVGKPKYTQVAGSRMPLYGIPHAKSVSIVVEGELDCMLLAAHVSDMVDVLTNGPAETPVPDKWLMHLACYRHILVCLDRDNAGAKGTAKWSSIAKSQTIGVPTGKDVTEFWQALEGPSNPEHAHDGLRAWVELQLAAFADQAAHPRNIPELDPSAPRLFESTTLADQIVAEVETGVLDPVAPIRVRRSNPLIGAMTGTARPCYEYFPLMSWER